MKKKNKCNYNKFENFKLPPCAEYLGNNNPIVHDGKIVYRNNNRLYFFITYNYSKIKNENYNPLNPLSFNTKATGNLFIYYRFIY